MQPDSEDTSVVESGAIVPCRNNATPLARAQLDHDVFKARIQALVEEGQLVNCGCQCKHSLIARQARMVQVVGQAEELLPHGVDLDTAMAKAEEIIGTFSCDCGQAQSKVERQIKSVYPGVMAALGSRKGQCGPELEEVWLSEWRNLPVRYMPKSVPIKCIFDYEMLHTLTTTELTEGIDLRPWVLLEGASTTRCKVLGTTGHRAAIADNLWEAASVSPPQALLRSMVAAAEDTSILARKFFVGVLQGDRPLHIWAIIARPTKQMQSRPVYVRAFFWDTDEADTNAPSMLVSVASSQLTWGAKSGMTARRLRAFTTPTNGVYSIYHLLMGFLFLHVTNVVDFDLLTLLERKRMLPPTFVIPQASSLVAVANKTMLQNEVQAMCAPQQAKRRKLQAPPRGQNTRQLKLPQAGQSNEDQEARRQADQQNNLDRYSKMWEKIYNIVFPVLSDKSIDANSIMMQFWQMQQDMRLLDFLDTHPDVELDKDGADPSALREKLLKKRNTKLLPLLRLIQPNIDLASSTLTAQAAARCRVQLADCIDIDIPLHYDLTSECQNLATRLYDEQSQKLAFCLHDIVKSAMECVRGYQQE